MCTKDQFEFTRILMHGSSFSELGSITKVGKADKARHVTEARIEVTYRMARVLRLGRLPRHVVSCCQKSLRACLTDRSV